MNPKQKKMLYRILAGAALMAVITLLPRTGLLSAVPVPMALLYLIPYLVVGWDVLIKALKGIKNRQPFDECFLMAVATVGASPWASTPRGAPSSCSIRWGNCSRAWRWARAAAASPL